MSKFLRRLLAGVSPTGKALRQAHVTAEVARLSAINRDPPPGDGWRLAPQDSEGKWTVWNGPRPVCSFWDENEGAEFARRKNRDAKLNPVMRDDGKYCVGCGSHETDESLKARGFVNCCPERYVIPEVWEVTGKLATGHFHLWKPAEGLPTVTDDSWADRADAQAVADRRNRLAMIGYGCDDEGCPHYGTPHVHARVPASPDAADALAFGLTAAKLAQETGEEIYKLRPYQAEALRGLVSNPQITIKPKDPDAYLTRDPPRLTGTSVTTGRLPGATPEQMAQYRAERRDEFLNVPIPEGVRMVVGPHKNPDDGNWWTFDRSGPVRGYTRKTNAQAAADRANNA